MLATPLITLLLASLLHTPPPAQAVNEDQVFVTRAVKDGQAEVDLATLAQKKAGSEQTGRWRASFERTTTAPTRS